MGLKEFLKKSKHARRVFGKRELEIIDKRLRGEPLTNSERTRLSMDIRKKFEFIEQASFFSDEFRLKWKGKRKKAEPKKEPKPTPEPEKKPAPKPEPKKKTQSKKQ